MPDSGIADGATFSSAFWDSYVREQVVTTCTSSTRPTNVEGRLIYETNTDRLLMGTGSGSNWIILAEPAQTWAAPTVSGLTAGNGTWDAVYRRSDGYCHIRGRFTLGSTSSVTGALLVTLPFTAASNTQNGQFTGGFYDSGTNYLGISYLTGNATQFYFGAIGAGGTYATIVAASGSVPASLGTGDVIDFSGTFRMANRYD